MRGFLQSGADFLDDHKYAREYLAPAVRSRWNPGKGTSIYDRTQGLSVGRGAGLATALVTRPRWRASTRTAAISASPSRRSSGGSG